MKRYFLVAGTILALTAGATSASTLDDVTIGASLFSTDGLDIIADDTSIEAVDLFGDVFIFAPIDGGSVDAVSASDTDLSVFDATFTEILGGKALDIAADAAANTLSILYELAINEESSDPLAIAVVSFELNLDDGILNFIGDLDGEVVDIEIFGAVDNPGVTIIPLPAGLPLFLGAMGVLAAASRRQSRCEQRANR